MSAGSTLDDVIAAAKDFEQGYFSDGGRRNSLLIQLHRMHIQM